MKRFLIVFLIAALLLAGSAAADPLSSYADVQRELLEAAYKVKPFNAILSGQIAAVVQSPTFENTYYLFIMVDPDDVAMWSTEDDNYFVTIVSSKKDPFPFSQGDTITVEGQVASIYSSPVCPYITADKINGSADY